MGTRRMNSTNASLDGKPVSVTVLGTGDAFASGGRAQSAYFVESDGATILLEAGPELLGSMKRAGLKPNNVDLILVSHLHGDHFAGIPFLMLEYLWESPLDHTVTIAGPRNLEARCWRLMETLFPRFELSKLHRKIRFVVIDAGETVRLGKVRLSAIRSPHTKPDISLSFRIEMGGKAIVFSGDSGWNEELVTLAQEADLFLCECTYYESSHLTFHMNYPQVAANRERFNARRMVLTHLGREVLNHKSEVEIEMAFDGMRIEL
jgi:ribonuclease BN (tRNA processing enzyme)